jgi:hypothetical protein
LFKSRFGRRIYVRKKLEIIIILGLGVTLGFFIHKLRSPRREPIGDSFAASGGNLEGNSTIWHFFE